MANTHSLDLERDSSQYAYRNAGADFNITGSLTIMAWVNFETTTGDSTIVSKWEESGNKRSHLFRYNGTSLQFYISTDGSDANSKAVAWTPSTGTWYHVAVVYNATAQTVDFYVNGSQQGTQQTGAQSAIYSNTTANLAIGGSNVTAGAQYLFDGLIDEVKVFNAVLTITDINNHKYSSDLKPSSLQGYWQLNNSEVDSSGNSKTLTLGGSPSYSTTVPFANYVEPYGGSFLLNFV